MAQLPGAAQEVGRLLEARVATYFEAHGYRVVRNAVLEGRSGGRHEIDVLATKADGVTSFTVAVECKAWQAPVEKDVVAKLRLVLDDLGIHKGIVVGLGGGRAGAHLAGDHHGIEVWDRAELEVRLGRAQLVDLADAAPDVGGEWGLNPVVEPPRGMRELADRLVRRPRRDREDLRWASLVWLPAYALRITVTAPQTIGRATRLTSTTLDGVYDAFCGTYLGAPPQPWEPVGPDGRPRLLPKVRSAQIHQAMHKAVRGYARVSSAAALDRHAEVLGALGLPAPCESVTIDDTTDVVVPYYLGIAESRAGERVLAVSAVTGQPSARLAAALTRGTTALRDALAR